MKRVYGATFRAPSARDVDRDAQPFDRNSLVRSRRS